MWTVISFIAAVLTTVAFVPQVVKIVRTKNTADISLFMYIGFCIGVGCWCVYGIATNVLAIILANGITFVLAAAILTYKIINVIKGEKP